MSDLLTLAAAGYGAAGEATYVEDVFSTYLYTGNGGSGASGTQAQVIENGIALSDANSGGSVAFEDGDSLLLSSAVSSSGGTGTNDFTFECWYFQEKEDTNPYTLLFAKSATTQIAINRTNTGSLTFYTGGSYVLDAVGTAVTIGEWHHIAFVRSGTTVTGYVDGVSQGSGTYNGSFTLDRVATYNGTSGYDVHGYIKDVRWVIGTAVYTSNFTPPTSPLTDITNTVLLTCQPDNPTTDASSASQSITVIGNPSSSNFGPFTSDTAGKGGLTWIKRRNVAVGHYLFDTERGADSWISSESTNAETTVAGVLNDFNANGFSVGDSNGTNANGGTYASWTFAKQEKFFDVVTYTGDGNTGRTVDHALGSTPGMIICKRTDSTSNWFVWHRSFASNDNYLMLNSTQAETTNAAFFGGAPTSTTFTVGNNPNINASGGSYVAYLFAHNDGDGIFGENGDQDIIKCGSFTTDSAGDATVDLGFEAQWILTKNTAGTGNWGIYDVMRGWSHSSQAYLLPNSTGAEGSIADPDLHPTATGFSIGGYTASSAHIYIAIRRGPMKTPTSGTEVFAPYISDATTPFRVESGFPVDSWLYGQIASTNKWFLFDRLRGSKYLKSNTTGAEVAYTAYFDDMEQASITGSGYAGYINYAFRRAPGFFDVVAYSGNGTAGHNVNHNLGVVPEMMLIKNRDIAAHWVVYHSGLNGGTTPENYHLHLTTTAAEDPKLANFNNTAPTSSVFTLGTDTDVNNSAYDYIAYLFATLPGVSKVGSFTTVGGAATVDCGFSSGPRFVLYKKTNATSDWILFDSERGIVAGAEPYLALNTTAAEVTGFDIIDPTSSGFTLTGAGNGDWIFLAIA